MKIAAFMVIVAGLASGTPACVASPSGTSAVTTDTQSEARLMADRAIAFLKSKQGPSGGWGIPEKGPAYPAITGLVLQGMLAHDGVTVADPAVKKSVDWLLAMQQMDGGIYDKILPVYNTAIALTGIAKVPTPEARNAAARAQEFLKRLQYSEDTTVIEGNSESPKPVAETDPFYGGWGYGNRGRPDLSNTAFAIEALRASGLDPSDPAFKRAVVFLQRCQMDEKINQSSYAKGSSQGGFIYATSANKDSVGVGQSFAGETVESLSGPAGSAATITLKPNKDGKPPLKKAELSQLLRTRFAASTVADVKENADHIVVLLGPNSDGASALTITVRAQVQDPAVFAAALKDALAEHLATNDIQATAVTAWQGETHLRAYGSMSYAGLKSYLYAGLSKSDPRVTAVKRWVTQHYTLDENPGAGMDGYYYYVLMFGRAMDANGEPVLQVVDSSGTAKPREWKRDLVAKLATLQQADGSFRSVDSRWMEDNDVLITAYALIALEAAAH